MVKKRVSIPKSISDQVLREFRHKCAICGRHEPQLHHIDEDPANNVVENLLPLCPNCHLQDSHNPTAAPDIYKVKLFRRTKDPLVLDPKFHPIWIRLQFLRENEEDRIESWQWCCNNLCEFIKALKMGEYYANFITAILKNPYDHYIIYQHKIGNKIQKASLRDNKELQEKISAHRATAIEDICVEMLRYQEWQIAKPMAP